MKTTTLQLLTCLYDQSSSRHISYALSRIILPDLSPGGRRSLIHHLDTQGLIAKQSIADELQIVGTHKGNEALSHELWALSNRWDDWAGDWELVIFGDAPASDTSFRYLRQLLLDEHALPVSRGVYALAVGRSVRFELEHQQTYRAAIFRLGVDGAANKQLHELAMRHYKISDTLAAYSGVSSEIASMLSSLKSQKKLTDRHKTAFYAVFTRFWEIVCTDAGISCFYYPDQPGARTVLAQLHELTRVIDDLLD